jgi:hypothetical protein
MSTSQRFIKIGIVGLVCAVLTACAGMRGAPTGFFTPGAAWEEVSREGMVFGEGVVSAPNGTVYFGSMTRALPPGPDNPGGTIFRFDPATSKTTKSLCKDYDWQSAVSLKQNGRVIPNLVYRISSKF